MAVLALEDIADIGREINLEDEFPSLEPGAVVVRRLVAGDPSGERMEWRLVVKDDHHTEWQPWQVYVNDNNPEILEERRPTWMALPGSQFAFLQCPVYEALYEGTRGPGKTITLLMDFVRDVGKGYGKAWRGVLFRREYKDLDDVVKKIEEWMPQMFPGFQFNKAKSEYKAVWPTGETLLLRAGEDEEAYKTFHGHEYPWIGFEELTQWENDGLFLKMRSCSRSSTPGMPCRIRATTNPYGPGHNWVKKRYQLPQMQNRVVRESGELPRVAIRGALHENFLLLHNDKDYPVKIASSTNNVNERKAWLFGDWTVTAGGMFDDLWNPRVHIVRDFNFNQVPYTWILTRAYDHGQSSPFAVGWWLESDGTPVVLDDGTEIGIVRGDLILWREWYGCDGDPAKGLNMPSKQIAQGIVDREEDWGCSFAVVPGPADDQIFNKVADRHGKSPADDMEDKGVDWERADKSPGSRKRGAERIRTGLQGALPNRDGTRDDKGFFVCEGCVWWIENVPGLPRDRKDPDDIADGPPDHDYDMTRYRVNWDPPIMTRRDF